MNPTLPFDIRRFSVGYDAILDNLELRRVKANTNAGNYPPFNIIKKGNDEYCIEIAIAGFKKHEIEINLERHELTVSGTKENIELPDNWEPLHTGISARTFTRQFTLAEHIVVDGAIYEDGILTINLKQLVPEELKPKRIEISAPAEHHKLSNKISSKS